MSKNQKQRTKHGAVRLLEQARRGLEKGNFKEALKDAKVCYRQQPDGESRQVLERAYLARARQLCRAGLRVESRDVAQSLLDLGATDSAVQQELPEFLIAVGLFDRAASSRRGKPAIGRGKPVGAGRSRPRGSAAGVGSG